MQMTLGRRIRLGHFWPIQKVFPLLLFISHFLQPRMRLYFCVWLSMCHPEVSLISVSNLILYFIHYEIVMIDLIPLFRHLYFLQVFLDPSETTITVMVDPIIIMMTLRASAVSNAGSRWALATMRFSRNTLSLSQCPPLPVGFHSFSSLLILDSMVAKEMN